MPALFVSLSFADDDELNVDDKAIFSVPVSNIIPRFASEVTAYTCQLPGGIRGHHYLCVASENL